MNKSEFQSDSPTDSALAQVHTKVPLAQKGSFTVDCCICIVHPGGVQTLKSTLIARRLDVAAAIGARVVAQGVRVSDGVTREKTGDGQLHTLRHAARTARSYWWRRQRGGVVWPATLHDSVAEANEAKRAWFVTRLNANQCCQPLTVWQHLTL